MGMNAEISARRMNRAPRHYKVVKGASSTTHTCTVVPALCYGTATAEEMAARGCINIRLCFEEIKTGLPVYNSLYPVQKASVSVLRPAMRDVQNWGAKLQGGSRALLRRQTG